MIRYKHAATDHHVMTWRLRLLLRSGAPRRHARRRRLLRRRILRLIAAVRRCCRRSALLLLLDVLQGRDEGEVLRALEVQRDRSLANRTLVVPILVTILRPRGLAPLKNATLATRMAAIGHHRNFFRVAAVHDLIVIQADRTSFEIRRHRCAAGSQGAATAAKELCSPRQEKVTVLLQTHHKPACTGRTHLE